MFVVLNLRYFADLNEHYGLGNHIAIALNAFFVL